MSTPVPKVIYLQGTSAAGATVNGNGGSLDAFGYDSAIQLEVVEGLGGTATLNVEGSFDGTNWYAAGYQQVDAISSLTRAVAAISVTANLAHVYQLLDPYPKYRVRQSSTAAAGVTVRAYLVS